MRQRSGKPEPQRRPVVEKPPVAPAAPWWVGLLVALLAVGVYANAFGNGHVWDDPIVLDRQLHVFNNLGAVFFPPRDIPQYSPDYYRPLTTLTYLLDRAISGTAPAAFHVSVVLYHALVTWLIWHVGLLLLNRGREPRLALQGATIAAALFAVHPIHTESVAWASGRSDVLAALGPLAALAVALGRHGGKPWAVVLATALGFLGPLAKETALPLLLLIPLGVQRFGPPGRWRGIAIGCAAAALAYLGLRQVVLGSVGGPGAVTSSSDIVVQLLGALGFYLKSLVLPWPQSAYISELPTALPAVVATLLLTLAATVVVLTRWRQLPLAGFLIVWVFATIAPSLAIVVKIPAAPVAERYLYLPSIGFCLLLGWLATEALQRWPTQRVRFFIGATTLVALLAASALTVPRNAVWSSNLALWTDTSEKNRLDALPLRSLAAVHLEGGDTARAELLFQQALQRRNNERGRYTIYNNLGSIAFQRQDLAAAQAFYEKAAAIQPDSEVFYNLGIIALHRAVGAPAGDQRQQAAATARDYFLRALQRNPHEAVMRVGLGQALQAMGDQQGARRELEQALQQGLPEATAVAVRKLVAELGGH